MLIESNRMRRMVSIVRTKFDPQTWLKVMISPRNRLGHQRCMMTASSADEWSEVTMRFAAMTSAVAVGRVGVNVL